jgi:hypothetical protein
MCSFDLDHCFEPRPPRGPRIINSPAAHLVASGPVLISAAIASPAYLGVTVGAAARRAARYVSIQVGVVRDLLREGAVAALAIVLASFYGRTLETRTVPAR